MEGVKTFGLVLRRLHPPVGYCSARWPAEEDHEPILGLMLRPDRFDCELLVLSEGYRFSSPGH